VKIGRWLRGGHWETFEVDAETFVALRLLGLVEPIVHLARVAPPPFMGCEWFSPNACYDAVEQLRGRP